MRKKKIFAPLKNEVLNQLLEKIYAAQFFTDATLEQLHNSLEDLEAGHRINADRIKSIHEQLALIENESNILNVIEYQIFENIIKRLLQEAVI